MPFDKLYVKIKCPMCDGTKLFKNSGHHSPMYPYKWKSCPYCDHDGHQLVEACKSTVIRYFEEMEEDKRYDLLMTLSTIHVLKE